MSFKHRSGSDAKRTRVKLAGLIAIFVGCGAAIAVGGPARGVMLDVNNANLTEVVRMLAMQSGANIIISPEVADKKVTAMLDGLTLEEVLDHVVKNGAGVDYWKDGNTYIIGGKRPTEAKTDIVVEPPALAVTPVETVRPQPMRTEVIKLVHSHPRDILVALGVIRKEFLGENQELGTVPIGEVAGVIDEDNNRIERFGVPGNRSGREPDGTIPPEMAPPSLDPRSGMSNGAGRSATMADGAGQTPGATPYRRPASSPATSGSTSRTGTTTSDNLLPEGVDMVVPFPTDNSLIVRGTDDGIAELKDIVHLLDVPPKQVSIKAEFIEVSTDDVKRFGIDWTLNRLNEAFQTSFNPSGNVVFGITTGNLAATLRTELTQGSGKTINSPIITTINNEFAEINIGRTIPYWTSSVVTPTAGTSTTSYSVSNLQVTTYLRVQPRVNGDGTITLSIMPSVQDTGRIFKGPDGTELPEVRYQTLFTRRRVMNGETIVCGGFIQKNESYSKTQIPILGDLPIIGSLFRSVSRNSQEVELLIFITPTIISDRSAGTSVGVSTYP